MTQRCDACKEEASPACAEEGYPPCLAAIKCLERLRQTPLLPRKNQYADMLKNLFNASFWLPATAKREASCMLLGDIDSVEIVCFHALLQDEVSSFVPLIAERGKLRSLRGWRVSPGSGGLRSIHAPICK